MQRYILWTLVGVLVLGGASLTSAQQAPAQVTRLGDWVEIGNDVFMNIIATIDARYHVAHNQDFESRLRDVVTNRSPVSAAGRDITADVFQAEIRWGADFRYQKNLTAQIFFEQQNIFDGNLIDDTGNTTTPGCQNTAASPCPAGVVGPAGEDTSPHIERFWIDYEFPGTGIHMRVGADIHGLDQARLVYDDDPRFTLYGKHGNFDWGVAAHIQNESSRLGLTNDNDFIYYTLHLGYDLKPHRLAFDAVYFRDRFSGATGLDEGQRIDSVLIMPSWTGRVGPVHGIFQPMFIWGNATSTQETGRQHMDILAWGVIAAAEVDLGIVRPFFGVIYGSGDDDPRDRDLNGFAGIPETESSGMTTVPWFNVFVDSPSFGKRNFRPGNAPGFNAEFRHSNGQAFSDRLGLVEHRDAANRVRIDTTYSNVGTLAIPAGVKIFPLKGHEASLFYMYVGMIDSALAESITARSTRGRVRIKNALLHEVGATWQWTFNRHFYVRLSGFVNIPDDGVKAIASTGNCNTTGGPFRACQGDDPAIRGELKFQVQF